MRTVYTGTAGQAAETKITSNGMRERVDLGNGTVVITQCDTKQILQVFCAMRGFAQAWNVELEVPEEEAKRRGLTAAGPPPPSPAAA